DADAFGRRRAFARGLDRERAVLVFHQAHAGRRYQPGVGRDDPRGDGVQPAGENLADLTKEIHDACLLGWSVEVVAPRQYTKRFPQLAAAWRAHGPAVPPPAGAEVHADRNPRRLAGVERDARLFADERLEELRVLRAATDLAEHCVEPVRGHVRYR